MTGTDTAYDSGFFGLHLDDSLASAEVVISEVEALVRPRSVLDVGCGVGTWLAGWRSRGIDDVVGVDGDYVDRALLQIPDADFHPADLSKPLDLGRRFDVVQSLEVAEHLDPPIADTFIDSLARHGDLVLFSAAIPGQGGTHHVNEQWPSFWVPKFEARGFELFDVLRPRLWGDERVKWWYRQNSMIFARGDAADTMRSHGLAALLVLDVAHPGLLKWLSEAPPPRPVRDAIRKVTPQPVRSAIHNARQVVRRAR